MQIDTLFFTNSWKFKKESITDKNKADVVFSFGDTDEFKNPKHFEYLKSTFPNAIIVGSSSAGNVLNAQVSDASIVAVAVCFENAKIQLNSIEFSKNDNLEDVSKNLVSKFENKDLKSIFIISDGLNMNGSILAKGVNKEKPNTLITGGLAGDGTRFEGTYIMANSTPKQNQIVAIAFYGASLHVSSGCYAGWDEFGAQRVITKSIDNVVYEIDNQPALDLYKKYLGSEAKNLPSSGLKFPLSIKENEDSKTEVIRTLLAIDEDEKSLTFAGDVPQNYIAKLMRTDVDGLIDGSQTAAKHIIKANTNEALGLVVSCVGRKLVMDQITDEELEVIEDVIGSNVTLTGFYSYGELSPFSDEIKNCQLHNQTMTLTVIYED